MKKNSAMKALSAELNSFRIFGCFLIFLLLTAIRFRQPSVLRDSAGDEHIGVFASRSPFRPNNIGLSCVCLDGIEKTENEGTLLKVSGVDILNGTPIYDIKPYIPYADSYPEACGGYAEKMQHHCLCVNFPPELLQKLPDDKWRIFFDCISDDPRPSYQNDPNRVYHIVISNYEVGFKVDNQTATVTEVKKI